MFPYVNYKDRVASKCKRTILIGCIDDFQCTTFYFVSHKPNIPCEYTTRVSNIYHNKSHITQEGLSVQGQLQAFPSEQVWTCLGWGGSPSEQVHSGHMETPVDMAADKTENYLPATLLSCGKKDINYNADKMNRMSAESRTNTPKYIKVWDSNLRLGNYPMEKWENNSLTWTKETFCLLRELALKLIVTSELSVDFITQSSSRYPLLVSSIRRHHKPIEEMVHKSAVQHKTTNKKITQMM